uniref:Novel STAND NTPase 3 domain-containing protein n=1 Tax=Caulobacter sp. (strain K31) TaxID=366602 RepID=B0SV38_CAUSK
MTAESAQIELPAQHERQAHGPWSDLALHTIGWRAFQDLCSQVCEVVLGQPVEIFREAQDGGQDAVFLIPSGSDAPPIGTVQCKHTSEAAKALKASDLTAEIDNVEELVKAGQADTYAFMTNMSVDAPVAAAMRARLRALGVRKPHILGRQYIVRVIKSSARLRALVPQVYGLGDLTSIVDERLSEQSRALLDSWIPKLRTYVPTKAHRDAINAISNHGVVLLLGNPSSGKSAIGAIISTIASENPANTVLALTSPRDFEAGWNPNDPGRFFWIDDAFGSNVLRNDFVQDWTSAFSKLRAAIKHGNRFLLTSRKHIYEAARRRLGQRNLAQFADGSAVVDVGELIFEEKAQILYNHLNFGEQSQSWRSTVKPHLAAVAAVRDFLPGIAERLGDPNFTKGLAPRESSLVRFMEEPTEHLIDTVNALDDQLQAALILVYVHQTGFDPSDYDASAAQAVAELTGYTLTKIQDCFAELKGSFLKLSGSKWTFAHPTISDALTEILRQKPHMMAALIRGATIDTILSSFTCEGSPLIRDALLIPATLDDALVARLGHTPDEWHRNWMLFHFLSYRANEHVFVSAVQQFPQLLRRSSWDSDLVSNDPHVATYARAHRLNLLPDDLRSEAANKLESAVLNDLDVSFFDEPEMLALIPPLSLIGVGLALRTTVLPSLEERIAEIAADADLDEEPDSHFKKLLGVLDCVEAIGIDADSTVLIDDTRDQVRRSIKALEERKRERDEESDDDTDWTHIVTQKKDDTPAPPAAATKRSVFDDVDK